MSIDLLGSGLVFVEEAPKDGIQYARQNGVWTPTGEFTLPVRRKSEVYYSNLNVIMSDGVAYNMIQLFKALTPTSGSLLPFFNTTSNKMNAYNEDRTLTFKLSVTGSFAGGQTNRAFQVDFNGTNGNRLITNRPLQSEMDSMTLATFFSIDKNGNIVNNGTEVLMTALGGDFTINTALIIAEQVTSESNISAV